MTYDVNWLKTKFDKGEPLKYIFFWGHSRKNSDDVGKFVFSQWFPSPFVVDNVEYKTAEHWMMGQKALLFGDTEIFTKITRSDKPGEVKELGRQIRNFDEHQWNERKFEIVMKGNIHKFGQHEKLKKFLSDSAERILVEASPTDSIWGIGLAEDAPSITNPHTWKGLNLLGFALMETRDLLRNS